MPEEANAPRDWSERNLALSDLLARTALGDAAAFAALYRLSSPHLFGVILRINSDRPAAEDLLQEVYVKVWQAAGSFDAARSQPLTWLTSVARNGAIDSLRRMQARPQRRAVSGDDADDELARLVDPGQGPVDLLAQATEARALHDCMTALSASQKQSVALSFFDGLSHAELAERLAQPLGTVKSWVRRGLQSLKACLDQAVRRDRAGEAEGR